MGQTGCECSGGLAAVRANFFFIAGRAFVFATSLFCSPHTGPKPAFRCSQFQKGMYEAEKEKKFMALKALQPLVANQAYIPQMKAMYVPFQLMYGGLICSKGLQSDRPKC